MSKLDDEGNVLQHLILGRRSVGCLQGRNTRLVVVFRPSVGGQYAVVERRMCAASVEVACGSLRVEEGA